MPSRLRTDPINLLNSKTKKMVNISVASENDVKYIHEICELIESSAKIRGTGIAKREPVYIENKILENKSVIAIENDKLVGYCYIESWGHDKFVANSGLIIKEDYRGKGIAKRLKAKAFDLSRKKFPQAKLFGITTNIAVMKINSSLGYQPVTLSKLTDDNAFWKGCESCVNYKILVQTERTHCLCTAMLFDPQTKKNIKQQQKSYKVYSRWFKYKFKVLTKMLRKEKVLKDSKLK